ncbi:MAG TPA: hypothetical protein VK116_06505, partial [Planctomycetota bacterium]|nr:hypothetical protein [Planctomycetota bacterium]
TGDQPPACLDAADNNADGKLDLSDPISSLTELFVGGGGTRSCVEHELSASLGCESYSSCE